MMHYRKGENIEQELSKDDLPFDDCLTKLPQKDFLWMHVRGGTKVHNVLNYAKNALDKGEYRTVVWSGSAGGVVKTVSCAEIFKRSFPLYQLTRMDQVTIEEHWEPQMDGLEPIIAKRKVPSLHILMTLDPIDESITDVQKPNTTTEYWRGTNGTGSESAQVQKQPRRNGPNTNNVGPTSRQRQNQRPPKQSRPDQATQSQNDQQQQSENNPNGETPRERQQRPQNLKRNRNEQLKARGENNPEQQSQQPQQTGESQQQRNGGDEQHRQQQSQRHRRPKPKQNKQQQQQHQQKTTQAMQGVETSESTTAATTSNSSATAAPAVESMES